MGSTTPYKQRLCQRILIFGSLAWSLICMPSAIGATPPVSEYQVKALFLFNFLKYVEWPQEAFSSPDSPLVIGVLGEDRFDGSLTEAVRNKRIDERSIVVKKVHSGAEIATCHLLFVSSSKSPELDEILRAASAQPILTVGEDTRFLDKGGIINFILKDEKIRLAINLPASIDAGLLISSRLLSVADVARGN